MQSKNMWQNPEGFSMLLAVMNDAKNSEKNGGWSISFFPNIADRQIQIFNFLT